MKLILAFFYALFVMVSRIDAQPTISTVSGTFSDGNSISISGSGFTSGPTVLVYDNFEGGSNNSAISTTSTVGSWSNVYTGHITYADDYRLSGNLSMEVDYVEGCAVDVNQVTLTFAGTTNIFFSYWQYLPVGRDVPGTNNGDGPNYKWWWLGDATFSWPWGSDYVLVTLDNSFGSNLLNAANDTDDPARAPIVYVGTFMETRGTWVRESFYYRGATDASGYYWMQECASGHSVVTRSSGNSVTRHSGEYWTRLDLPGYGRSDNNSVIYYDDVYVSIGADSRARSRVEIGNNATYSSCTNLSICNPTSWSGTSISAVLRQSTFSNGTAYVFVVDSSNTASAGYQITLGASASVGHKITWIGSRP